MSYKDDLAKKGPYWYSGKDTHGKPLFACVWSGALQPNVFIDGIAMQWADPDEADAMEKFLLPRSRVTKA